MICFLLFPSSILFGLNSLGLGCLEVNPGDYKLWLVENSKNKDIEIFRWSSLWVFFHCHSLKLQFQLCEMLLVIPGNTNCKQFCGGLFVACVALVQFGQDEVGFQVAALSNYVAAWPAQQ